MILNSECGLSVAQPNQTVLCDSRIDKKVYPLKTVERLNKDSLCNRQEIVNDAQFAQANAYIPGSDMTSNSGRSSDAENLSQVYS